MTEEVEPAASVHIQAVDFEYISNVDLRWIAKADRLGHDSRPAGQLIQDLADQRMRLWRISGPAQGVLIVSRTPSFLWVEAIAGNGLIFQATAIRDKLHEIAGGLPVKCAVSHPILERLYRRMGYRQVAVIMEA